MALLFTLLTIFAGVLLAWGFVQGMSYLQSEKFAATLAGWPRWKRGAFLTCGGFFVLGGVLWFCYPFVL